MKQQVEGSRRRFLKTSSVLGLAVAFNPSRILADSESEVTEKDDTAQISAAQQSSQTNDKEAIRPFRWDFSDAQLTNLRKRVNETNWPQRELVSDASQGVQLATMQKLARYWGTDYDWRKGRSKTESRTTFHHRDRWSRHSLHPRSLETRKRSAGDRHTRLARLDH